MKYSRSKNFSAYYLVVMVGISYISVILLNFAPALLPLLPLYTFIASLLYLAIWGFALFVILANRFKRLAKIALIYWSFSLVGSINLIVQSYLQSRNYGIIILSYPFIIPIYGCAYFDLNILNLSGDSFFLGTIFATVFLGVSIVALFRTRN